MRLLSLALVFAFSLGARAATYRVGAERADKTLAAVLPRLKAGDVVELDPGVYHEVNRITSVGTDAAPITIRGVGAARATFDASGLDTSGRGPKPRGALEITGAHIVLEHLDIENARNGNNAAGVRLLDSTGATIRDCHIHDCDMGVFGGDKRTATVERCEVDHNGTDKFAGYSHNFYMSGNAVLVRDCWIHDATYGQNYKSRAHFNELRDNWITGSNEGEVGLVDAPGATDTPNSNAVLVGNFIQSRPDRTGNGAKFILFGSESGGKHTGTLFLWRNTLIAGNGRIRFISLDDPGTSAQIGGNVFVGSDQILTTPRPPVAVQGAHNLLPATATVPDGWTNEWPRDPAYVDGEGMSHVLGEAKSPNFNPYERPTL